MSQSDQTAPKPKHYRPYVSPEAYQIVTEQAAKAMRLHGTPKTAKEWLEEAIAEKKAREDLLDPHTRVGKKARETLLEEPPQAQLLQIA